MPRKQHARPLPVQPTSAPASRFLPPQPLADRDRGRGLVGRLGPRGVIAIATGAMLVVAIPITFAALGPAAAPLRPLTGVVAGAVAGSHTQAPAPSAGGPALVGPASVTQRGTDPDGPHAVYGVAPTIASLVGYQWPISKGWISLPFKAIPGGTRIWEGKLFHDGVDMASFCGASVGAAHAGVVLAVGRHFDDQVGWIGDLRPYFHLLDVRHMWIDLPNVVVIDDGNGYRSIYAHFHDVTVTVGQVVKAGQPIGHEGATGHASGCHVHYGLFSPFETKTMGVRADLLRQLRLPKYEIARIDPLLVLPGGEVARRTGNIPKAIAAAKATAAVAH